MLPNNLIPAIDLLDGKVVQLKQGLEKKFESDDIDFWIEKFKNFSRVHVIDLNGAFNTGNNLDLIKYISSKIPIHVGGGIRSIETANTILNLGVEQIILGSCLYSQDGIDLNFLKNISSTIGKENIIAGIDCKDSKIAVKGWSQTINLSAKNAIKTLEPFVNAFLHTNINIEGTLSGIDIDEINDLKKSTNLDFYAAGGISTLEDIRMLDSINVKAVSGMAIYMNNLLD